MTVPNLSYRQLEAIVTVAEWGNISHAAVQLSMSQPALSRMVSNLEAQFGVALFSRDARGVALTDAGGRLVEHAREALHHLNELEEELRSLDGTLRGKVCVVVPDPFGHAVFLPLMDRMIAAYPEVEMSMMGAHPNNVPLALSAGEGDVGVLSSAHRVGRLQPTPLVTEQLYLVGPNDSGGGLKPDLPLEKIGGLPLALPGILPGLRPLIDRAFASKGVLPNVVMQLDSQDALLEMVREGRAWSVMSLAGVIRMVSRGELSAARIVEPTIDRTFAIAIPDNRPATRLMAATVEAIRATVAELAPLTHWEVLT